MKKLLCYSTENGSQYEIKLQIRIKNVNLLYYLKLFFYNGYYV